jgi:hypothetical protein
MRSLLESDIPAEFLYAFWRDVLLDIMPFSAHFYPARGWTMPPP